MNNLIKISENQTITAKELYDFLGLNPAHYARWTKKNVELNEYYQDGQDWQGFTIMVNGNKTKDFELTIDFAKHLCMLSRSAKGKQARDYFIEVEKRYLATQEVKSTVPELPMSYLDALKALVSQTEKLEEVEKENVLLIDKVTEKDQIISNQQEDIDLFLPKAERYDCFMNCNTLITMDQVASSMAIKGYGRNNLFRLLKLNGVLQVNNNNVPYRRYIESGHFKTIETGSYFNTCLNRDVVNTKTMVTPKGQNYIYDLVMKEIRLKAS